MEDLLNEVYNEGYTEGTNSNITVSYGNSLAPWLAENPYYDMTVAGQSSKADNITLNKTITTMNGD